MIIGTPIGHNASVPIHFVKSLLAVRGHDHIFEESCDIPTNRNKIFEFARLEKKDLLFIDSDMVFTPHDVAKMVEHLKIHGIVTGVAVMQFPNWPPAVFDERFKSVDLKDKTDLFEVHACGAAFLGISSKVIQDLIEPFNKLPDEYGRMHGEDISFCLRARQAGYKIYCDPKLLIGHIKTIIKYYG